MFHDEYHLKQRLRDLQDGYKHFKIEQQYRSVKRKSFREKLLRGILGSNEKVKVKQQNRQPSFLKE